MVVVIVVGAIYSIVNKQPAFGNAAEQTLAQENTAQPLSTASIPYPDVPRISLQETQDKLEQGEAVLVDVRSKAAYDQSHAAEAISIPEGEIADRLGELPRDKVIILYCT
jgi:3-mercaptopyruvate sulfurtransferase SseA